VLHLLEHLGIHCRNVEWPGVDDNAVMCRINAHRYGLRSRDRNRGRQRYEGDTSWSAEHEGILSTLPPPIHRNFPLPGAAFAVDSVMPLNCGY
jgi:hypothetical protein